MSGAIVGTPETPGDSIYDSLGLLVIRVDSQLRVWYVNAFGLRLLGHSRLGQVFRRSLIDVLGADSLRSPEFLAEVRDIGGRGGVRQVDTSLTAADGRRLRISWTIEQRTGVDTLLAPIFLIGTDVTRAYQSMESALLFRDIAQSSPLSIIITDAERTIVFANPAALAMSGYDASEVIGRKPGMFRSGMTPPATYQEMWEALGAGSSWSGEVINQRKDGAVFTERMTISPITDQEGCIQWYFAIAEDWSSQHELEKRLAMLTSTDALTGLCNRAGFLSELTRMLPRAAAGGMGISVAHIDIDDFESVNRLLGHENGDRFLAEIGRRLADTVRGADVVARLGGDEFGLLLVVPESPTERDCDEVSERLLAALRPPVVIGDQSIEVTPSIGFALFPADGGDAGELLGRAVSATQKAKRDGGDTSARFDRSLSVEDAERRELFGELRHVVDNRQLLLHYQPQVSLQTGALIGLEALVRWLHPQRGLIPPGRFIPWAEESGLIITIGEWVLVEACRQMRQWLDAGFPPIKVAVNLSARHFRSAALYTNVSEALAMHHIDPRTLELEITEGAMMHDVAAATGASERLKAIGVRLSLDDFGTGYSSLAYLSRFPIDIVKIDQSFVRNITTDPGNATIAQAIIAMSHKLGKIALAEGVETDEQMHYLRRNDCDEMQGYLFSRPLPADQLAALRSAGKRLDLGPSKGETLPTVLLVDDEPSILSSLNRLLRREGYRVLLADSADAALVVMARETVEVIVSDQRMPLITGTELLARVKMLYPRTVRMVLSGYSEISAVTDAINRGAIHKYLSKPWDDEHLKSEIRDAFRTWKDRFGQNDAA
ncbi:MAG: EAL domain-containing protein [Rhodobacteraceae bacterium]|uniref:EAL domain-containing protein n=1 Tax=Accumulibacter sp. TaxID=2053492 RepID=UPI0019FBFDB9|nr:EAL domain-containing protein [Accumulibacter sp.]MBE2260342.1 EAL domain-containing protein [Paracoccaceae bacterium]